MNDIIDKALSICGIDMSKNPAYEYKLTRASIKKISGYYLWISPLILSCP